MKTILYNSETENIIGWYSDGYKVDGQPKKVQPPIYELSVSEPEAPEITDNQVLSSEWVVDLINKTYTKGYSVMDKTEAELILEKEAQAQQAESELNATEVKKLLMISAETLSEEQQAELPSIYPSWKPGIEVVIGNKYQWANILYKCDKSHTTQLDWEPQDVPALFTRVPKAGEILDWVQPTGAHDAYQTGEKVRFEGSIYESLIDANVWSPTVYGWVKI